MLAADPAGLAQQQMASLHPGLVLRRVSPTPQRPDGPVLYQFLFNASGTPGTVPVFDTNPRHLANSEITDNGSVVMIGGSKGLVINSSGSILTFAGVSLTASGTGGLTAVSHDSTLAGSGTAGLPLGIANGGVGTAQVGSGSATSGQVLTANGSGGVSWQTLSPTLTDAWSLSGNSGTCPSSPCAEFLGTNDNDPFEIHVNGQRALRIEPGAAVLSEGITPNIVAGFSGNLVKANSLGQAVGGATIAGGGTNSFVNTVSADLATIGGGQGNTASNVDATVAGGVQNTASGTAATVAGGFINTASGDFSTVGGGTSNIASGPSSTVAGGLNNTASGNYSFAAGQHANTNGQKGAFVWSDSTATSDVMATSPNQFIIMAAGGVGIGTTSPPAGALAVNGAVSMKGFVMPTGAAAKAVLTSDAGGIGTWQPISSASGGTVTQVDTGPGLSGGPITSSGIIFIPSGGVTFPMLGFGAATSGQVLTANGSGGASWTTISGGGGSGWSLTGNAIGCTTPPCTDFLGTTDNSMLELRANGLRALDIEPVTDNLFGNGAVFNFIGGANNNMVSSGVAGATIAGGGGGSMAFNRVTGSYGSIGGGFGNTATQLATVAGGQSNSASGNYAVVGGGHFNSAIADESTVPGGGDNTASNSYSTVGGGDSNIASGVESIVAGGGDNTASGYNSTVPGGIFNTASGNLSFAAGTHANTNGEAGAFVWSDATAPNGPDLTATAANQFLARASGGFTFFTNAGMTTGVSVAAGGGSWASVSDRNLKANIAPIDPQQVLARLIAMPVTTWNYKSQAASVRHLGPMAQDFYAAFNVGEDDKHITEIDEGGVAFAAIQGLAQKLENELKQKDAQIAALQRELAQMKQAQQKQVDELHSLLSQLLLRVNAIEQTRVAEVETARQ